MKKDILSFELFTKIVADLSAFPDKVKLLRICGNGEPLTNKSLLSMLKYAHEKQVVERVELITNGLLLTPRLASELPGFAHRIVISIEGLNVDDYQRISGTKIDYKKFVDHLAILYESRKECIIHIKINHEAVRTEEKEKEFFSIFGGLCDEIFIEKLVPMWPQAKTSYATDQFRYGGSEVISRKVCAQIFKAVQVQADGEVVACCVDWKRINKLGRIGKESLLGIWEGERMRKLRIAHLSGNKGNVEPCKDCTMNDYCDLDNLDGHAEEIMARLRS